MEKAKYHWQKMPAAVRKPMALIVGTAVIIIGLILVPLPGPGWAIVFGGVAVLSTEFAVAEKARKWIIAWLKYTLQYAKLRLQNLQKRH